MENRITEQASAYDDLQRMSVHDILTGINREDARVHEAVRTTIPVMERLVERIVERMECGGPWSMPRTTWKVRGAIWRLTPRPGRTC